ncbi:tetratricopeptide repeat protein [Luteolibacter luteus]|uniref:Tetratricopeptide repeat protein n=1 Tax=Luteolibacter luteus TaxID=2728835 RepID=A0A858RM26_9BACT|nr:tetratricopeptide repeat protein [Luteolibacter luteus]QJE97862.1 tetratricopeptide repeat protein [Luteolibacter luteus]
MAQEPADTPRPLAEISHGPSAFDAFLDRNQKGLMVLGVLIALGGGAVIVMKGMKESRAYGAGEDLSKAETLADLQEVPKKHEGTPAAGSAAILIASKQWDEGNQDASIETLKKFIADSPDHPGIPSAKASLATRLMQQGKTDEAAALFREVADGADSRFLAPYALVSLGDIEKAQGKLSEAEATYKKVSEDYKASPFGQLAQQHLQLVNFKMPVEIEAPPAPAPTPGAELKPELTPGAGLTGEMGNNPLGNILNGEGATPAAPVEEVPALPEKEEPATPEGQEPAKPSEVLPAKPEEGGATPPQPQPGQ